MKTIITLCLVLCATQAMAYGDDDNQPRTYQTYGNTSYGSDGSVIQRNGNQTYDTDRTGHTTTYQTYGNQTYGSDGTVIQRYGNQTYVTKPPR